MPKAEELLLEEVGEEMDTLIDKLYANLQAGASERDRLFYIADLFDDIKEDIWYDTCHLPGEGNRIVAARMSQILESIGVKLQ